MMTVSQEPSDIDAYKADKALSMAEITVLKAEFSYELLDEIEKIEKLSFSSPWSRESLSWMLKDKGSICLAAMAEGKAVGYGSAFVAADEGNIENIAVSPSYRRQGVGRKIVSALIEEMKNRGALVSFLEVRESNIPAKALYASFGFVEVGRRKNYYRFPLEDAIVMRKDM